MRFYALRLREAAGSRPARRPSSPRAPTYAHQRAEEGVEGLRVSPSRLRSLLPQNPEYGSESTQESSKAQPPPRAQHTILFAADSSM